MAKENFPALPAMPHTLVKIPAAVLEEPDCQNQIRYLHGRIALHAERRLADPEA
jgi:hypothetical protein